MKTRMLTFQLAAALLFLSGAVNAQNFWQKLNGPWGGDVHAVHVHQGIVFASAWSGKVYTSTDAGYSWQKLQNPSSPTTVTCFASKGATLVAGTYGNGILKSSDNGTTWNQTNFQSGRDVWTISIAPNGTLYAGCNPPPTPGSPSVYYSTDDGTSWQSGSLTDMDVRTLAANQNNEVFAGTYAGGTSIVYRGNGALFNPVFNSGSVFVQQVCVRNDGRVFIATEMSVFLSTNNGGTWSQVYAGHPVSIATNDSGVIFVGEMHGWMARSTNDGNNWTQVKIASNDCDVYSITSFNASVFAGTHNTGVFRSTDSGVGWEQTPLPCALTRWITTTQDGDLFAGTERGGVFRSTNGGGAWTRAGLFTEVVWTLAATNSGTLIAGTQDAGLHRSTNKGQSWQQVAPALATSYIRIVGVHPSGVIFARGDNIPTCKSTDDGQTWTSCGIQPQSGFYTLSLAFDNSTGDIYVDSTYSYICKSTNLGASWIPLSNIGTQSLIYALEATADGNLYAIVMASVSQAGVYRSTNRGALWQRMLPGNFNRLTSNSLGHAFVGGQYENYVGHPPQSSVYSSTNQGASWTDIGLPYRSVVSNYCDRNGYVYVGTWDDGVYRSVLSTGVAEEEDSPGAGFKLSQNYPNPFNPSTNIRYQVPSTNRVTLKVFDLLGREVRTLVNEELKAGSHVTTFDATDLATGVYLYRLQSGSFIETKKLMLVR